MYTLKSIAKHNINFVDSFIDLKVVGWKSFEKALNAYTYGMFAEQLQKSTENVEKFAKMLKTANEKTLETI